MMVFYVKANFDVLVGSSYLCACLCLFQIMQVFSWKYSFVLDISL